MLRKLDKLRKQLESIQAEIGKLTEFRETKALKKFQRQLKGEMSVIKENIKKLTITKEEKIILKKHRQTQANRNRSTKNKRVWNYVKRPDENFIKVTPFCETTPNKIESKDSGDKN